MKKFLFGLFLIGFGYYIGNSNDSVNANNVETLASISETTNEIEEVSTPIVKSTYEDNEEEEEFYGRCMATTKKGTQCKRSAARGSHYCWQHK